MHEVEASDSQQTNIATFEMNESDPRSNVHYLGSTGLNFFQALFSLLPK